MRCFVNTKTWHVSKCRTLQVADQHAPNTENGDCEHQESKDNVEDLMSQLNALSAR